MISRTLAAATFGACLLFPTPLNSASSKPVIIKDNTGGKILRFEQQFDRLKRLNVPVRLSGECLSACTFFVMLPNACAEEGTELGYHAFRDSTTNELLIDLGRHEIAERSPPAVAALVEKYKAYEFAFLKEKRPFVWQKVEPNVWIRYRHYSGSGVTEIFQKFLVVDGPSFMKKCSPNIK